MRKQRGLKMWTLGLCALAAAPVLAAGNPEAGRTKAFTCMGCHGVASYTNAYPTYHVPKLGGQHAQYLVAAMQAYQNSQRPHGTMHAQIANLSAQDLDDIAAYFAARGE